MATFYGTDAFTSPKTLASLSDVAAAVQYLLGTDIGSAGATLAFMATINSITHTFVYEQGGSTNANGANTLVDLSGTSISDLNALISTTVDPIVLDLGTPGISFTSVTMASPSTSMATALKIRSHGPQATMASLPTM